MCVCVLGWRLIICSEKQYTEGEILVRVQQGCPLSYKLIIQTQSSNPVDWSQKLCRKTLKNSPYMEKLFYT
jgi:hypothetical protein